MNGGKMTKLMIRKIASFLAIAAISLGAGTGAKAALSFSVAVGNVGLAGFPGPYGTLSLSLVDSTHATVTLTAAAGFRFGAGQTLGLNLASAATIVGGAGGITGNGSGTFSIGSGNVDGWGTYNLVIDTSDGFTDSATSITFRLLKTSGSWASESQILGPNGDGLIIAAHVFVVNPSGGGALATGFATVPEPTTLVAGALLLLPFGASTIRVLRNRKT